MADIVTGQPKVFFSHTFEAQFLEAFPPTGRPGLLDRYAALGVDFSKPLLPAYEYAIWRACLVAQREEFLPHLGVDDASREQGARFVQAYFERTLLGKPLLLLLRALGPRRTLERMATNFRSANNFSDVKVRVLGPRAAELGINDVFSDSPEYISGMLGRGLEMVGTAIRMKTVSRDGDAATFAIEWT
ncbi:MAG: DUF2378 family protein [Myxococcota bacterium]|jgi:uncharacterized protein (TIGR02265 family)